MSYDDLAEVYAIEIQCFTTPWAISSFKHEMKCGQTIINVAVFNNQIVGYICIRTILDVTHVLNLAVLPSLRRMGIASILLWDAMQELRLSQPDGEFITLEVRESNTAAIKLYEKFEFKLRGKRTGYYHKPYEDAVIMGLKIGKIVKQKNREDVKPSIKQ